MTMPKQQWYAVCAEGTVRSKPVALRRFGRPLVLWRAGDGTVVCAVDACAHRGAALSRGRIVDGCLTCPYHGLRFDADGQCVHVPAHPQAPIDASLRLRRFAVRVQRGLVWVWNGSMTDTLPPLPWDDAFEEELTQGGGPFVELSDTFDVSYLRVMENLTDFHHVAHVHRRTAPAPAEVLEFEATRQEHHIRVRGVLGSSTSARRFEASTHIVAPFLANLNFVGLARFAAIATPVDDTHVWLFARYTQTALRIPGLTTLLTRLFGAFDYRLLQRWEDLPTWRSQRLDDPADVSRYQWLAADEGIKLYFEAHRDLTQ